MRQRSHSLYGRRRSAISGFITILSVFNNQLRPIKRGAPLLGEDTDEILKSVGYSEEEIARLHRDEVVASHLY